jgi:hypothetical protein
MVVFNVFHQIWILFIFTIIILPILLIIRCCIQVNRILYLLDNDNEDICPFLEKVENYYKKPINELIVSHYHYYIISHLAKEGLNHTIAQLGKYGLFINEVPFNQTMEYKNLKTA